MERKKPPQDIDLLTLKKMVIEDLKQELMGQGKLEKEEIVRPVFDQNGEIRMTGKGKKQEPDLTSSRRQA